MTSQTFLLSFASLVLAGLLVMPMAADAAVTQDNTNTGPGSTNENKVKVKVKKKTVKNNVATVTNSAVVNANTGGNKIKHNTTVGSVTSGDALVNANVVNTVNNPAGEDPCCCANNDPPTLDVNQTNDTTGPASTNLNVVKIKHKEKCEINNVATVVNSLVANLNTGENKVIGNTNAGDVSSGGAVVNVNFTNTVN